MADDLAETIRENASGPAEVQGDQGSMRQHRPGEVIESDRYLRSLAATKRPAGGLRITKLVPHGAT